jgi:hypothetical protein
LNDIASTHVRALHSVHKTEDIEQLEMIRNHVLLKSDYPKVVQLQYMRANFHDPSIVNHNFTLQFQIRPIASNNKTDSHAPSLSYQSNMKGNAPSRSNIQIERTYQS